MEVPQGTEAFQGRMFRLETRAREIAVMASLTFNRGKAKGNRICAFFHLKKEAMDLKGS